LAIAMGAAAEHVFDLSGGRPCLDFANTVSDRPEAPKERLRAYGDLVAWARQSGLLDPARAQELLRQASRHPAEAEAALERARALRERLFELFAAAAAGQRPPAEALAALNAALPAALSHRRLARGSEGGFRWEWDRPAGALDAMLWPVVHSAAALLASDELSALRECAADSCAWLFLDHSRNHSRRWCDMKVCGNRTKARRHYERARREAAKPS
jgi:predicted RNA-binding Zn ribbon-like protein